MFKFLSRLITPGMRSSEFAVTALAGLVVSKGWMSPAEATPLIGYVLSRGLAKFGK